MSRKDLKKMKISEETMISNKDLQEQYISRVDVLDKVKDLFLIPAMECMTMKQVADYYEVDIHTIQICYTRNKDELDYDGVCIKTPLDFKEIFKVTACDFKDLEQKHGKLIIHIDDNTTIEIPNRGIKMFPKRAILRVGMLLRDSVIAKEVRTQLLNIVEVAQEEKPEIITQEIQKEEDLLLNISKAFATGNVMKLMTAMQEYSSYKDRHIKRLENDKKLLTADILTISDRQMFNAVMRKLVYTLHIDYPISFGIFYKQLNYKYGINLKARGDRKPPYIRNVREDEWDKVQKSIVAILEDNHINATEFLESCKPTNALKSQNH